MFEMAHDIHLLLNILIRFGQPSAQLFTHRIEVSRLGFYPELATLLNRVAA